jgi:hypothetical protein
MTELSQPAARIVRPTSAGCMLGAARSAAFIIGLKLAPHSLRCELHLTAKASARILSLCAVKYDSDKQLPVARYIDYTTEP